MPFGMDAERRLLRGDEKEMKPLLLYCAMFAAVALIAYVTFTAHFGKQKRLRAAEAPISSMV